MRLGGRPFLSAALSCAALLAAAPAAFGSVTIGQAINSGFVCGGSGYTDLQGGLAAPPAYTVPNPGGVITSWSHAASGDATVRLRLKLFRATSNPNQFSVVGQSAPTTSIVSNSLNTFATAITARPGDEIGLSVLTGTSPACGFTTGNTTDTIRQGPADPAVGSDAPMPVAANSARVNVSAVLETQLVSLTGQPNSKVKLKGKKKSRIVRFTFGSSFSGLGFQCSLDAGPPGQCVSPASFRVRKGAHAFHVQATDGQGPLGEPVSFSFRVKKPKRKH